MQINSVAVFCGSRPGDNPLFSRYARYLGKSLAKRNIKLVYGGGKVGLMGVIADAVIENNGEVEGVIPRSLAQREVAHMSLSRLYMTDTMHGRKEKMYELSDAFIIIPGGIGTLDEFFEIYTWFQLGYHVKPIVVINSEGFYDHLQNHIENCVNEGFLSKSIYTSVKWVNDVDDCMSLLFDNSIG
ncbi:TIGR00730 family Rossman fold protein [Mangrovivirga sp. M17]|uniref:Cytokinin riboside 5'-monophosphate phosphoribohydrolase n=1 Tax=Mangrovivirga halotolerans TaxID=2993936 RepID=A0ABT3RUI7_9BACT|nr:TIGR00730 family Rossman fold protein [Mangrovivirga halotolerans]MCX2745278.1 TIGR00730 family Rossman fold protein [Mangrovivirga halotolerans]